MPSAAPIWDSMVNKALTISVAPHYDRAMVGPLTILAAASLAPSATATPALAPTFRTSATAQATARIQIISGVKFGPGHDLVPPSALRRSALLVDAGGQVRPAELLEFQ